MASINTPNSLSAIAYKIMLAGLFKQPIEVPEPFRNLALGMFEVPERPQEYVPQVRNIRYDSTAILVSGGLDSYLLYHRSLHEGLRATTYYVDLGQPYSHKELMALDRLGVPYQTINVGLGGLENLYWKHIIPGRNLLCLCLVAERMEGGRIWFGALDGEMPRVGGDKSYAFLQMTTGLFACYLPYHTVVQVPFLGRTKTDIVRDYLAGGGSSAQLMLTVSCFDAQDGHCGRCQACLRKALAFISNGLELETHTPVKVGCAVYIEKYKRLMGEALQKQDFSRYSQRRCEQDLHAISLL